MRVSQFGLLLVLAVAGCEGGHGQVGEVQGYTSVPDGRLTEVGRRVILGKEEIRLVDIDRVSQHPARPGLLLVVDRVQERALLIDVERRVVVARSNPSELPRVVDAAFLGPDSAIISDVEVGLHVAASDLSTTRSIPMQQQLFAARLHVGRGDVLVESTDTHNTEASLFRYSLDGDLLWRGGGFDPERVAPFWGEFYQIRAAQLNDRLFVASSMEYPLRLLEDGDEVEFGSPPPGYREPRRPVRFEFSSAQRQAYEEFARSFTVISSMWATGGLLYVEHRDLDPGVLSHRKANYTVDIYDAQTLRKVAEALPLRGPVLRAFDGRIEVLAGWPPDQDWTLATLELQLPGGQS